MMYLYEVAKFARGTAHAAELYLQRGVSVIPLRGKKPAVQWTQFQLKRASVHHIDSWQNSGYLENIGIVCGAVSHNLVVVDLDGVTAVQTFQTVFPKLLQTYTVKTGSGKGLHLYYTVDRLPDSTRLMLKDVGNFEVRANGCQVVAPPSIHPDTGQPYRPESDMHVMHFYSLKSVIEWINRYLEKQRNVIKTHSVQPVRYSTRYGKTALASECAKVATAPIGDRNTQLNKSAFKLGQLIASGQLTEYEVQAALYRAAGQLIHDDGEIATRKTILSGLNAGIRNPR